MSSLKYIPSPEDRHQSINVVLKKKQPRPHSALDLHQQHSLIKQVKNEQQNTECSSIKCGTYTSSNRLARHSMSCFSLRFPNSTSLYQPQLEDYQHDDLSQKQIDRLSDQYSSSDTIQQLFQHTPSLTSNMSSLSSLSEQSNDPSSDTAIDTNCPLVMEFTDKPTQSYRTHQFPISPPTTSPNTPICLSTSSSTSFPSPKTTTLVSLSMSKAILPKEHFYYPSITHIQKNNGMRIRTFLGQSALLDKRIRLDRQALSHNPQFFKGNDEQTGQAKAILKLSIIKLSSKNTEYSVMAPFGIGFINSAQNIAGEGGGSTSNMNNYASIPDSLVTEALNVWLSQLHLPHLTHASHIMRIGIKLYIVFDISVIH